MSVHLSLKCCLFTAFTAAGEYKLLGRNNMKKINFCCCRDHVCACSNGNAVWEFSCGAPPQCRDTSARPPYWMWQFCRILFLWFCLWIHKKALTFTFNWFWWIGFMFSYKNIYIHVSANNYNLSDRKWTKSANQNKTLSLL